jgi:hypothetical protein
VDTYDGSEYDEDVLPDGTFHEGTPKAVAESVSKWSPAKSAAKGAPKTLESNSDEDVFPGIDDKIDTTGLRAYYYVTIVKCHNKHDSQVLIVNPSEYSLFFFPFLISEQSNVIFAMLTFQRNSQTYMVGLVFVCFSKLLTLLAVSVLAARHFPFYVKVPLSLIERSPGTSRHGRSMPICICTIHPTNKSLMTITVCCLLSAAPIHHRNGITRSIIFPKLSTTLMRPSSK